MTSSLGSVNFLEQVTEVRETSYQITGLLQRNVTQEQPDGRDALGRAWGEGVEHPCLSEPTSLQIFTCSPGQKNPILSDFYGMVDYITGH